MIAYLLFLALWSAIHEEPLNDVTSQGEPLRLRATNHPS